VGGGGVVGFWGVGGAGGPAFLWGGVGGGWVASGVVWGVSGVVSVGGVGWVGWVVGGRAGWGGGGLGVGFGWGVGLWVGGGWEGGGCVGGGVGGVLVGVFWWAVFPLALPSSDGFNNAARSDSITSLSKIFFCPCGSCLSLKIAFDFRVGVPL